MSARAPLAAAAGCLAVLTSCGSSGPAPARPSGIAVKASDTTCEVESTTLQSGTQVFAVSNAGSQATGVYVYAAGDRIVGSVEGIGPSVSKRLVVALKPGQYQLACKPGMVGNGIRTPISVKAPNGATPTTSPELEAATASYREYVIEQARLLVTRVAPFVAAVKAGDVARAKTLYPAARVPYETIEPIAAYFGDLDSRVDARIDDIENGQEWLGFHRLEHDLWVSGNLSADAHVADALQADAGRLLADVQHLQLSGDEVAGSATNLMNVAAGIAIAGQEERYSRLDLVDFAANVTGADQAYQSLRPMVLAERPALAAKLDTRFAILLQDIAQYGSDAAFQPYDSLSKAQLHTLASEANALLAPLSDLTSLAG